MNLEQKLVIASVSFEFFFCFVLIVIFLYFGFKRRWHGFQDTTVTHLVWSPLVIWYLLLSTRLTFGTICLFTLIASMVLELIKPNRKNN